MRYTVVGDPDIAPLRRSSVRFGGAGTGTSAGPPRKQREQFQARNGDNPPGGFEQEVRTDSTSDSYLPQNSCTGLTGCAATTIRGCGAHYHFEPDTHSACSISCFQFSSSHPGPTLLIRRWQKGVWLYYETEAVFWVFSAVSVCFCWRFRCFFVFLVCLLS